MVCQIMNVDNAKQHDVPKPNNMHAGAKPIKQYLQQLIQMHGLPLLSRNKSDSICTPELLVPELHGRPVAMPMASSVLVQQILLLIFALAAEVAPTLCAYCDGHRNLQVCTLIPDLQRTSFVGMPSFVGLQRHNSITSLELSCTYYQCAQATSNI